MKMIGIISLLVILAGCTQITDFQSCTESGNPIIPGNPPTCTADGKTYTEQLIGGDKDEHGCIGSAGYSWCAEKQKCIRPWEEQCVEITDFESCVAAGNPVMESYPRKCGADGNTYTEIIVGGDRDDHDCIGSAGYSWCEEKQKCLRPWEESCASIIYENTSPQIVGGDKDEHGCIGSAGYTWCEEKQSCIRPWEEPCSGQKHICTEKESTNTMCTMEYNPVCGELILNTGEVKYQTYGNGCSACAGMKVVSYVPGEC